MALGLGVVAAISFATNFLEGIKSSNEMKRNSSLYANQAEILRRNAERIRFNGAINEDIMRSKNRNYLARALTAGGEAGMSESPTMMSMLATTLGGLEQNVLNARYQVESEAENYLYQARVQDENARVLKKKSSHAFQNGLMNGIYGGMNVFSSAKGKGA
jgi:hypothetical protein